MYAALKMARDALDTAADKILEDYRTWVADDVTAKPRYGQIPAYDAVNAAVRECEDALLTAPTVAAQQCGLEAAEQIIHAAKHVYSDKDLARAVVTAYLASATPPDVAGLVERLEGPLPERHVGVGRHGDRIVDYDYPAISRLLTEAATALRLSAGGGWQAMPAPTLERVVVAGWQPRHGATAGYWWFHEDATDDRGIPFDHPTATLWVRLKDVLPPLPASPTVEATR